MLWYEGKKLTKSRARKKKQQDFAEKVEEKERRSMIAYSKEKEEEDVSRLNSHVQQPKRVAGGKEELGP